MVVHLKNAGITNDAVFRTIGTLNFTRGTEHLGIIALSFHYLLIR